MNKEIIELANQMSAMAQQIVSKVKTVEMPMKPKKVTRDEIEKAIPNVIHTYMEQVELKEYTKLRDLLFKITENGYDDGKPEITYKTIDEAWTSLRYRGVTMTVHELCKELGLEDEGE